jgi:hypothetical protein
MKPRIISPFLISLFLLSTLVVSARSQSQAVLAPATVPASGAASEKSQVGVQKCKKIAVTGSRFQKRVCGTEEEWKDMQGLARKTSRELDAQPLTQNREGGNPMTSAASGGFSTP